MIGKKTSCRSGLSIVILMNLGILETAYFVTKIRLGGPPTTLERGFKKMPF